MMNRLSRSYGISSINSLRTTILAAAVLMLFAPQASAIVITGDGSFEIVGSGVTDPSSTFFIGAGSPLPSVDATIEPFSGEEHAILEFVSESADVPGFGPSLTTSSFIADPSLINFDTFNGETLVVNAQINVAEFDLTLPDEAAPEIEAPALAILFTANFFTSSAFAGAVSFTTPGLTAAFGDVTDGFVQLESEFVVPDFVDEDGETVEATSVSLVTQIFAGTPNILPASDPDAEFFANGGTATVFLDDVFLELVSQLPGDFDASGFINAADFTVFRDNIGAADELGISGNGDGLNGVDLADFDLLVANIDTVGVDEVPVTSAAVVGVPEPGTLALAAMLAAVLPVSRRRRC